MRGVPGLLLGAPPSPPPAESPSACRIVAVTQCPWPRVGRAGFLQGSLSLATRAAGTCPSRRCCLKEGRGDDRPLSLAAPHGGSPLQPSTTRQCRLLLLLPLLQAWGTPYHSTGGEAPLPLGQ
ncbi:hypothetical protein O3P69_014253 [Scylla paramamosain]|uniref:Uncharacterized protein n=1 Tax=Scylla paramamosain TaxID=85552 RepID=A0AAW0TCT3_SCYPA